MPEKPEAQTMADRLNADLAGYYITQFTTTLTITGLDQLIALLPRGIVQICSRGKKVIWELEGAIFLITSLGMTGRWVYFELPHVKARVDVGAFDSETSTLISMGTILFDDSRKMGDLQLAFGWDHAIQLLANVGPDLLLDTIPFEHYYAVLKQSKLQNWCVNKFLKEQQYFSGVGNYLVAEIMYRARLRPDRPLCSLTSEECQLLYTESIATIKESYAVGGFTIERYLDPTGAEGRFKPQVYGRRTDNLGNEVVATRFSAGKIVPAAQGKGQTTWWVPAVQK